jgi:hypothetical protein
MKFTLGAALALALGTSASYSAAQTPPAAPTPTVPAAAPAVTEVIRAGAASTDVTPSEAAAVLAPSPEADAAQPPIVAKPRPRPDFAPRRSGRERSCSFATGH